VVFSFDWTEIVNAKTKKIAGRFARVYSRGRGSILIMICTPDFPGPLDLKIKGPFYSPEFPGKHMALDYGGLENGIPKSP